MEEPKMYFIFIAALIPLLLGAIWYNPKVFGTAWMKASGLSEEDLTGANMAVIFLVTYIFSVLVSFALMGMVIHQSGIFSLLAADPEFAGSAKEAAYNAFMADYGTLHRSFGHGALHGGMAGIAVALPILGTNAMFERKGWKYILINTGYWFVAFMIMGGILCEFM